MALSSSLLGGANYLVRIYEQLDQFEIRYLLGYIIYYLSADIECSSCQPDNPRAETFPLIKLVLNLFNSNHQLFII